MNKIKRLPTLEEARVKSYRELFYQVKNLQSVDSVFQLAPPQVMLNPEAMNYPVFEFTLDEVKDAYLSELENKIACTKDKADFYPHSNANEAIQRVASIFLSLINYLK